MSDPFPENPDYDVVAAMHDLPTITIPEPVRAVLDPAVALPSVETMLAEIEQGYTPLSYPTLADVEEALKNPPKAAPKPPMAKRRSNRKATTTR